MAFALFDHILTPEYLQREYVEKGRGSQDIGQEVGAHPMTVRNYLARHNITRRCCGASPARMYTPVDATGFIKPDSEGHAYWIGFLAADGAIETVHGEPTTVTLKLAAKDTTHVEAFRQFLGTNAPIKLIGQPPIAARLRFTSRALVSALAYWGIVPKKTLTMPFPHHLPPDLLPAYIRGFFDGDGTIMWRRRGAATRRHREVVLRFTSGSSLFLEGLQRVLNTVGIETIKPYNNGGNTYVLPISGRRTNAQQFATYLYAGATIYLPRKHAANLPFLEGTP